MKHLELLLSFAVCVLLVVGCAPGGSAVEEPAGEVEAVEPSVPQTAAEDPAGGSTAQLPEGVPDRESDPAGHYNWRVDQMFLNRDADQDGMISRDEFAGNPAEFDVMDADKDGYLSKEEVADYVFARFVVPPVSSVE